MAITDAQINAVLDWFYNERAIDIQGLSNQDNPALIGRKYLIVLGTSGNITTIELSAADMTNFKVNQVVKFTDVADAVLRAEISLLLLNFLTIANSFVL